MSLNPDATRYDIINGYDSVVKGLDKEAMDDAERDYGGVVRTVKGKMLETIASYMVSIAWKELNEDFNRISLKTNKIPIQIRPDYVESLPIELARHIKNNMAKYVYRCGVDLHVFIDEEFALGIECKSYTENAMIKRILLDFNFLVSKHPNMSCMLLQLESQLTGDYNAPAQDITYGSYSTHTLMSHFPSVDLTIVTLLEGERDIKKPIHKFYKPIIPKVLDKGIQRISTALANFS